MQLSMPTTNQWQQLQIWISFQTAHWRESNIQLRIQKMGVLHTKAWRPKCCPLPCILVINVVSTFENVMNKHNIFVVLSLEIRNEMWASWSYKLKQKEPERLGLHEASDAQIKLISSLIIARPVSPSEATLACLQIPVVQKNWCRIHRLQAIHTANNNGHLIKGIGLSSHWTTLY